MSKPRKLQKRSAKTIVFNFFNFLNFLNFLELSTCETKVIQFFYIYDNYHPTHLHER